MKNKMRKYEDGGEIESVQGENKAIGDDTRARAMAAIAAGGQKDVAPAPKRMAKTTTKKLAMPDYSNEDLDRMGMNEDLKPLSKRRSPGQMLREEFQDAQRPPLEVKGNRLMKGAGFNSGGKVKSPTMSFMTYSKSGKPAGMKTQTVKKAVGGKISSASKRADGCAVRGKTRA